MASEDTRTRILEHGSILVQRDGVASVRIADVAAAAGVSRQAVYLHFPSRAELLTEILRHLDLTAPSAKAIRAAMTVEPAAAALPAFVRAYYRYLPDRYPLLAAVQAAAHTDEAAQAAWRGRKHAMRGMLEAIVRRVSDAGQLRDGWTVERATDWIVVRLHPTLWHELVHDLGWSTRAVVEQLLRDVHQLVLSPRG